MILQRLFAKKEEKEHENQRKLFKDEGYERIILGA
jgi:hypothetical protein